MTDPFTVGEWFVEPEENRIRRGGEIRRMEPRIMAVLDHLAHHPGRVVRREDLLDDVWKDVVVNEDALTRAVSDLRLLLGDEPSNPVYIETVRGVGYRMIADVSPVGSEPVPVWRVGTGDGAAVDPVQDGKSSDRVNVEDGRAPWNTGIPSSPSVIHGTGRNLTRVPLAAAALVMTILASWMVVRSGNESVRLVDTLDFRPVTSTRGFERSPTLAPEDTRIAYSAGADFWAEEFDIFVTQPGGEGHLRLTDLPGYEDYPTWSPDGMTVLFAHLDSEGTTTIKSVPAIGGPITTVLHVDSWVVGLDFSPVGDRITFAHRPDDRKAYSIALYDEETARLVDLTRAVDGAFDTRPTFSPDGRYVAFVRSTATGLADLYVVETAGGAARRVTPRRARIRDIAWTPDGRQLLYATGHAGSSTIRSIGLDGRGGRILRTVSGGAESIDVGIDHVVIELSRTESDVFLTTSEGGVRAVASSTAWDGDASPSPDGRRIALVSNRSGSDEIWVVGMDGAGARAVTESGEQSVTGPHWSPDGRRLAFHAGDSDGGGMYVATADGRNARRVGSPLPSAVPLGFSRDGRHIYYSDETSDGRDIWALDPEAGTRRRMTRGGAAAAAESADGQYLYFTRSREDGLFRIPLGRAADPVRVSARPHRWARDSWQIDGDRLVYLDMNQEGRIAAAIELPATESLSVAVNGATPFRRVLAVLPDRTHPSRLSVVPGTDSVLFSSQNRPGSNLQIADW